MRHTSLLRRRETATLLALLLLSGILFFFRLGTPGLFDADEPAYAQAAREMLETGDWITPHFNGRPRFDKPILFYWLIALGYRIFGVTEFAVRFWSALAGVTLVLLVAWAARRRFGPPADLLAGLAFTTNLLTALLARAAVTDMLLTLFVTAAILAGVEALDGSAIPHDPTRPRNDRRWARMAWAAMGLAVLVKGPVGLLIPAMALGGALLVSRELRGGLAHLVPWEGPLLFAVITLPWYGLALAANGWAFVEGFVIKHHVTRYTGVVSSHAGPIWFYLPVVLIGFFPWSGFLPRAVWHAITVARRREGGNPADRLLIVCACWAAGVFVFFSLAGTKLPSYIFPAFPALALLVGAGGISKEERATDNRPTATDGSLSVVSGQWSLGVGQAPRWLARAGEWLIGLTGGTLALGVGMIPWILESVRPLAGGVLEGVAPPVGLAWWLAALLTLGTASGLLAREPWRPALLSAMMALFLLTAAVAVAPRAYAILQAPLREFAEDARDVLGAQGMLVAYGLNAPSIVFYAQRPVTPLGPAPPGGADRLRRLLEAGRPVVVITRSAHAPRLDGVPGLYRLKSRGGYAIYSSLRRAMGNSKLKTDPPLAEQPVTSNGKRTF
ncbi:MAG: glycosyltransferase family 39 protein [candidate division NC10 bacterium]|nr:glycosyltransferase family 39 protein [candidate division NC10 bacterium]